MTRAYVVVGGAVLVIAGFWVWSPANLEQTTPVDTPEVIAERAATAAIVAEGRLYCLDPKAKPRFTIQLGACLPGAREISYVEYQAGIKEK